MAKTKKLKVYRLYDTVDGISVQPSYYALKSNKVWLVRAYTCKDAYRYVYQEIVSIGEDCPGIMEITFMTDGEHNYHSEQMEKCEYRITHD